MGCGGVEAVTACTREINPLVTSGSEDLRENGPLMPLSQLQLILIAHSDHFINDPLSAGYRGRG